jgi:hypothetical protein
MLTTDFPRVSQFVASQAECSVPASGGVGIGWLRDDALVAGVLYEDFTGEDGSITGTITVLPGSVMTKEFTKAIFWYPFRQLKVRKILAMVASNNHKSARLVEHMGFEPMTTVVGYYPDADMVVYEMTADKCRWLEN